mgnify:CR=1 FL=1
MFEVESRQAGATQIRSSAEADGYQRPKWMSIAQVAMYSYCIQQYEHIATGAMHIHLASQQTENVFLVALKTMPQYSTGVAHVL